MKARRRKKQYKRWLDRNAFKIMCRFCDIKDACERRALKEGYEKQNIITRCTHTPNKRQKVMSYEKVNKKGEIIGVNRHGIPLDRFFSGEKKLLKSGMPTKNGAPQGRRRNK
jgi:hypothetical protein